MKLSRGYQPQEGKKPENRHKSFYSYIIKVLSASKSLFLPQKTSQKPLKHTYVKPDLVSYSVIWNVPENPPTNTNDNGGCDNHDEHRSDRMVSTLLEWKFKQIFCTRRQREDEKNEYHSWGPDDFSYNRYFLFHFTQCFRYIIAPTHILLLVANLYGSFRLYHSCFVSPWLSNPLNDRVFLDFTNIFS